MVQIVGQGARTRTGKLARQVARVDRADDDELLPGAGYGDVEPALAAFAVQRPQVPVEDAVLIRAVADAEHDHVALVALHALQVLDEETAGGIGIEVLLERAQLWEAPQTLFESVFDSALLRLAERHHPQRPVGAMLPEMLKHQTHTTLGLLLVLPRPATRVHPPSTI